WPRLCRWTALVLPTLCRLPEGRWTTQPTAPSRPTRHLLKWLSPWRPACFQYVPHRRHTLEALTLGSSLASSSLDLGRPQAGPVMSPSRACLAHRVPPPEERVADCAVQAAWTPRIDR